MTVNQRGTSPGGYYGIYHGRVYFAGTAAAEARAFYSECGKSEAGGGLNETGLTLH